MWKCASNAVTILVPYPAILGSRYSITRACSAGYPAGTEEFGGPKTQYVRTTPRLPLGISPFFRVCWDMTVRLEMTTASGTPKCSTRCCRVRPGEGSNPPKPHVAGRHGGDQSDGVSQRRVEERRWRARVMRTKWIGTGVLLMTFLLLTHEEIHAQAMTEYGKQMEGLKPPTVKQKPLTIPSARKKTFSLTGKSQEFQEPSTVTVPSTLSVERSGVYLYANREQESEVVTKLDRGEKLVPFGQALGTSEAWYMVKTQKGALGWVRSSDVGMQGNKAEAQR